MTLKSQKEGGLNFKIISVKGAELGHLFLLTINRNSCMEVKWQHTILCVCDIERSHSTSISFECLYITIEAESSHMLPLNSTVIGNDMCSPYVPSNLTLHDL